MGGKSQIKVYFFIFTLIITVLLSIVKTKNPKEIDLRPTIITISILFTIGFCLNYVSFYDFIHKYKLAQTDTVVIFNNQDISSNQIAHIHTLKHTFGSLISKIGIEKINKKADVGLAYLSVQDDLYSELGLILIILIVLSWFYLLRQIKKSKYSNNFLYLFLLNLIIVTTIKNIFDGGVLNTGAIFIFSTLFLFVFPSQKTIRYFYFFSIIGLITMFSTIVFKIIPNDYNVGRYVFYSLFPTLIIVGTRNLLDKSRKTKTIGLLLLAIIIGGAAVMESRDNLKYIKHDATNSFLTTHEEIRNENVTLIEKFGDLYFYKPSGGYVNDWIEIADENPNYRPIGVPYLNCQPNAINRQIELSLISEKKPQDYSGKNFSITATQEEIGTYNVVLSSHQCYTNWIEIINEWLKINEAQPAIIKIQK